MKQIVLVYIFGAVAGYAVATYSKKSELPMCKVDEMLNAKIAELQLEVVSLQDMYSEAMAACQGGSQ